MTAVKKSLEDVETDDLIEELESRGHEVDNEPDLDSFDDTEISEEYVGRGLGTDIFEDGRAMFEAFYVGQTGRAVEIARKLAEQAAGRYL